MRLAAPSRRTFCVVAAAMAFSFAPSARAAPNTALRSELEGVYRAWRTAHLAGDYQRWASLTCRRRRMEARNTVISQLRPWPAALFATPLRPPAIAGLRRLPVARRGELARLACFGRVDWGAPAAARAQLPENLLLIRFQREEGRWKLDHIRYINLAGMDKLRIRLRQGDAAALDSPSFRLPDAPPAIPAPVARPDHAARLIVQSIGCRARIEINGRIVADIAAGRDARPVIGGLRSGDNPMTIRCTPLPGADPEAIALSARVEWLAPYRTQRRVALWGESWVAAAGKAPPAETRVTLRPGLAAALRARDAAR